MTFGGSFESQAIGLAQSSGIVPTSVTPAQQAQAKDGAKHLYDYLQKTREDNTGQSETMDELAANSPSAVVSNDVADSAISNIWDRVSTSPMAQLGKDYVAEQIAMNGHKLIKNADTMFLDPLRKPVKDIQSLVYDGVAAALTAKNDLAMYMVQQVAKQILIEMAKKRKLLLQLQTDMQKLYNALVLLVNGQPFFTKYLAQLRQALILIFQSRNQIATVRNTLKVSDIWLKTQFAGAREQLNQANKLMEPQGPEPDVKFTQPGLLQNVGIVTHPQQLQIFISIPLLAQNVLADATGYFIAIAKINVMLFGFVHAMESFTKSGNQKLTDATVSLLDQNVSMLDSLISEMAAGLNGDPDAIMGPSDPIYEPNSIAISTRSLKWILQLKAVIEYLSFVPGPTFETLAISNLALSKYQAAQKAIKAMGNVQIGDAKLTATEGREEIGDLEKQVMTFVMACYQALVDGKASKSILALGRTILKRLELTITRDDEIVAVLTAFATAELGFPDALKKTGDSLKAMLRQFGLDKAADSLDQGLFGDFFNMNSKTMTYAGAAIVGISWLSECLTQAEDREQLNQAMVEIQREQKAKELLSQRTAYTGYAAQKQVIIDNDTRLANLENNTIEASNKCGIPQDFMPTNLLKNAPYVAGVNILGSDMVTKQVQSIGRGIL